MRFISYAQNFEDVMLWRALKHIEHGFYIDVGANLPEAESVTKAFYDRGWSGINIEPTNDVFEILDQARPNDTNLHLGCWSETTTLTMFLVEESAAFNTFEPAMAKLHRSAGRHVTEVPFPVMSLRDICEKHVGDRPIHFLKLDVEGGEYNVVLGADLNRWRPWIIVAEAHGPDLSVNVYSPWEDLLFRNGYRFTYCDGLNRFYIASERFDDLQHAFRVPPNVYDEFVRATEVNLLNRAEFAERTRAEAWEALEETKALLTHESARSSDLSREMERLRHENADLTFQLQRLYASTSWRVTTPLRWLKETMTGARQSGR